MVNYDELPLFPLHVVLYPEMPLPLHIFEPRYCEMIQHCRDENCPFGIVLLQAGRETTSTVAVNAVGTTARITRVDEIGDGRMNILVTGESRFEVLDTELRHSYLTARTRPIVDDAGTAAEIDAVQQVAGRLFKDYVKMLFLRSGRTLSTLQIPQEPCYLSYAIATFLPISLVEKQRLLESTTAAARLAVEVEILGREIEAQGSVDSAVGTTGAGVVVPADSHALGQLASRN